MGEPKIGRSYHFMRGSCDFDKGYSHFGMDFWSIAICAPTWSFRWNIFEHGWPPPVCQAFN
jgi:hypothetical protein